MSEYPSDWTIGNLGDHLEETKERAGSRDITPYSVSKVLGIVPQREKFNKRVASSDTSNYKVIRKGDFAYDPMLLWDGSINRMLRGGAGAVSPAYVTFSVVSGSLDADYLLHLLKASTTKTFYKTISKGTNVRRQKAEFGDFAAGEFAFPPLTEQKKIAEILSGIDNLTQAVRERIYRLQIALDGLANSWETQLSIRGEEGILGDLIDSIDSGWSPACEEFPPKPGEWGVLKVSAVTRGEFYEAESKRLPPDLPPREQFIVKKDDLLITRANGNLDLVGRGVIVSKEPDAKLLMSDKILRLNPRSNCDRNFLLLALNSRSVRQQIEIGVGGSTGAKNIGQGFLRQIAIAIPSSSDQIRIGNLSRSLSTALISTKRKFEHLVSLKKGLSSDLLSGRKRVSV